MKADVYDHFERRCPRLGHRVGFEYCRTCGPEGAVCPKTADCWWEYFDIVAWLRVHLTEAAFQKLAAARPQPKVLSLVELIAQAKARNSKQ
ncbi:hypothetical protein DENIS_0633 [Desulfonema ishimotonii]|uniref:Uncharacterized protein n=1 Tax=Desulfonema ishimotonii TaxID=45657 RepID=A0A401FRU2_9BACT|nr:hypothetical protein [Desulfonema ishimotonii]GBC59692.1 hypothetical protein DENIS_0633 [Desulfonema ishimotonii]